MQSIDVRPLALLALVSLSAGCSSSRSITGPIIIGDQVAYVLTSDFSTGGLSVIDLATHQVATNVASVHSDASLRVHGGLIYVVNRFGQDNIQVIDPNRRYATRRQFSTGNGSNPQDIAFASQAKAYVSRYASADLLIVDPRSGIQLGTISLAAFADGDGIPEMDQMAIVGSILFVACQRLTNFSAANPSVVVVIDTRTDELVDRDFAIPGVQGIALTGRNPLTDFAYDATAQQLLIGCVGAYGVTDGGIERIDVAGMRSLGYAITEAALGGDVLDVAWNGREHSYAIVSDASFNTTLVGWNARSGAVVDTVYAPGGFSLPDCEVNGLGELYACNNSLTAPGVWVFGAVAADTVDAGLDTLIAGPLDTGLPPVRIAFP